MRLPAHLAGLDGYETNRYGDLEPRLKARILREWAHAFDAWGYASRRSAELPA